jgi:hypothetical protein
VRRGEKGSEGITSARRKGKRVQFQGETAERDTGPTDEGWELRQGLMGAKKDEAQSEDDLKEYWRQRLAEMDRLEQMGLTMGDMYTLGLIK